MPSLPSNAEQWADKLCEKILPILPYTGSQFIKNLNTRDISLAQVSKQIQLDPILSLQIFIEANRNERNASSELLKLEHCVSLLGLKRVKSIALKLPILKIARRSYCYQRYLSTVQQSEFSAQIASAWMKNSKAKMPPDLYYPTLFYGTGAWLLWRYEIAEIYNLNELIFNKQLSIKEAEEHVFGCTVREISVAINTRWKLPSLSQDALKLDLYQHRQTLAHINYTADADARIHVLPLSAEINTLKSNAAKIKLANELVSELQENWHSKHSQRAINISAALLNTSPENQRRQIQQLALSQSKQFALPGIDSPAGKMLQLPYSINHHDIKNSYLGLLYRGDLQRKIVWKEDNILSPEQRTGTVQKRKEAKLKKPITQKPCITSLVWKKLLKGSLQDGTFQKNKFDAFILQLKSLSDADNKINTHEILKLTVTAQACCMGFSRAAFFKYDQENNKLNYLCGTGFKHEKSTVKQTIKLEPPQLFLTLLSQPTGLWVSPNKRDKISAMLPKGFLPFIHKQEFALMTIFISGQASGVFYCDKQGLPGTISETQYDAFKFLCQTSSNTLSAIELNKPPANQSYSEQLRNHIL